MAEMKLLSFFKRITLILLLFSSFLGCRDKELTPEEKAVQFKEEIMKAAPVNFDYKITSPNKKLPEILKMFSGRWAGKWEDKYASQLIVKKITSNKAEFIYSWQGNTRKGIKSEVICETAEVKKEGRLIYNNEDESLTFAIDTLLNKIIGVQLHNDKIKNIVMTKIE